MLSEIMKSIVVNVGEGIIGGFYGVFNSRKALTACESSGLVCLIFVLFCCCCFFVGFVFFFVFVFFFDCFCLLFKTPIILS